MKKGEQPEFSAKWWKAGQPKGLKSAKKLEDALGDYERQKQSSQDKRDEAQLLGALEALEQSVKLAIAEAAKARGDAEMDATVDALKKFNFAKERSWIEASAAPAGHEQTDAEGVFAPAMYKKYLLSALRHVSDEPAHFCLALGAKPDEHRLAVDRTQTGRALALRLRSATGLKRLTFGTVTADPERPATLVLALEAPQLAGMKKKGQAMLKSFGPLPFTHIAVFVAGEEAEEIEEIEDAEEEDDDDGPVPAEEASSEEKAPAPEPAHGLDASQLKAAMERVAPALKQAIAANPGRRDELAAPLTAFVGHMKANDLAGAQSSLKLALQLLKSLDAHAAQHADEPSYADLLDIWETARAKAAANLKALEDAILQVYRTSSAYDELHTAVRKLDRILEPRAVELSKTLGDAKNAAQSGQPPSKQEVSAVVERFRDYVKNDRFVADVDDNPFEPLQVQETLSTALGQLAKSLAA